VLYLTKLQLQYTKDCSQTYSTASIWAECRMIMKKRIMIKFDWALWWSSTSLFTTFCFLKFT